MRERDIERYLVRRVKDAGGEVRKVKWIGRRYAPDRLVMLPGKGGSTNIGYTLPRTVWVEVKGDGGRASKGQAREHARMMRYGMEVLVLWNRLDVDALFQ
jgi:hypothetical protein